MFQNLEQMKRDRQLIQPKSKSNFGLERQVNLLDKQIHLLIKQQIRLHDIVGGGEMAKPKVAAAGGILKEKKALYETMFYILQKNPQYFAAIAPEVEQKDMRKFVNTIVFDMYG